jgi:hypothetical protein
MLKIYTSSLQAMRGNWYVYVAILLLEHARGSHNLPTHIGLCQYVSGASYVEYLLKYWAFSYEPIIDFRNS